MAKIPKRQDSLTEILESGMVEQEYRPYIGMSGIMGKCQRKIWYGFRWSYPRFVPKRTQRLFDRGDLEEARVVKDLRAAGVIVTDCLEDQITLVDQTGHIGGHPDGEAINVPTAPKTPHLLEIKTMANKYYQNFKRQGLAKSDPVYWGQVHTYCGEKGLTRILFCVTNKDTEERTYMRYEYDPDVHKECMSIAMDILTSEYPPKKIGEHTWFECKMCDAKGICHKGDPIKRTCRSCQYVDIEMDGKWKCGKHKRFLDYEDQMLACGDYELSEVYL
jgi:hypothetical protein